jgi:hypothetical protein
MAGMTVTEAPGGMAVTKVSAGGLPVTFVSPVGGGGGTTYAKYDGTVSANVLVTNGGLTVTHGSAAASYGAVSSTFKSTGKYYFEVVPQVSMQGGNCMGILLSTGLLSNAGIGNDSFEVVQGGTIFSNNGASGKSIASISIGNVIGFAIDLTARLGWIRNGSGNWNGDPTANPATGVGGVTLVAGGFAPHVLFAANGTTDAYTANFGASAFSGAVPAGFTSGWPV